MRFWLLTLATVNFLAMVAAPRLGFADTAPAPAAPADGVERTQTAAEALSFNRKQSWEFDAAVFSSLSVPNPVSVGTVRFMGRRFFNDVLAVGMDVRYWPAGTFPLSSDPDAEAWAAGASGQLYLFRTTHLGVYVGGSLLWVPTYTEAAFAPEVGFKWFANRHLGLGVLYSILTDIGSYTTSFEPNYNGKSRQSLGLELSVYL